MINFCKTKIHPQFGRSIRVLSFSLLELIIVITVAAILSVIAIPAYKTYITKIKVDQIFTIMNYYKLQVTDAFINQENIDKTIHNPIDLITKLSVKALNIKTRYLIHAVINAEKVGLNTKNAKTISINLIGTSQDNWLVWECQIQGVHTLDLLTKENCKFID